MVLAGVDLPHRAADTGAVVPYDHEQVLRREPHVLIVRHYLHMRETLPVRAHLVLTLHDEHPAFPEYAVSLLARIPVQLEHRLVVFALGPVARTVVPVVVLEGRMRLMRRAPRRVHVRGVEHHAVDLAVPVRQLTAVDAALDVCRPQLVPARRDAAPEHALAVGDIRHDAPRLDVETQYLRKGAVVSLRKNAQNQVVRRQAVGRTPFPAGGDSFCRLEEPGVGCHSSPPPSSIKRAPAATSSQGTRQTMLQVIHHWWVACGCCPSERMFASYNQNTPRL